MSNRAGVKFDRDPSKRLPALIGRVPHALAGTLRRLLPQACALCAAASGDALLCPACTTALPGVGPACPVCALPAIRSDPSPGARASPCGACLARPPPFSRSVAAWIYAFPVDRLVQALKYGGRLALAEPLGDALAAAVLATPRALPQVVVPLPLAPARQRERGFNQAHEIARRVAARIAVPLAAGLDRRGDAPPQASLPWSARARNVRAAFAGRPSLNGRRVALVDDVMTTGATLAAAARAARRAGAVDVEAWVVARTLPPVESLRN